MTRDRSDLADPDRANPDLANPDRANPDPGAAPSLVPVAAVLVVVALLVGVDLVSDLADGVPPVHLVFEAVIIVLAAGGLVRLRGRIRAERRRHASEVTRLRADAATWRESGARWRVKAETAARSFVQAVDEEFLRWGLSPAEREVAMLLLKGVSHREIADARGTSERTVRQQAGAVYTKAGVGGRSELASYFLDALPSAGASSSSDPVPSLARPPEAPSISGG